MPADRDHNEAHDYTRRSFLGKLVLGAASVAGAGFMLKGLLLPQGKEESRSPDEFPGEDSIFHPRRDPRQEALDRRKRA